MIRVFSIEDHWMVTDGLKTRFRGWRDGIIITRSATGIEAALKYGDPAGFDIILLDLFLPETDPIDNIRLLKAQYPDAPIVILTGEEQDIWRIQVAEAGAVAYLTKRATRSELVETLKRVYQGENLMKMYFLQTSQQRSQKEHFSSPFNIKPTEKELLNLLTGKVAFFHRN
jgi:DNA-binding NarL/FixJ family response regulator